jgi:hypothetical protein
VGLVRICAAYFLARGMIRKSGLAFVRFGLFQLFWTAYLNIIQVRVRIPS